MTKLKQILGLVAITLGISGCFGSCKVVLKPANPSADPELVATTVPNAAPDALTAEQWSIAKMELEKAWSMVGQTDSGVRVALLGTGVDYNHEDLRNNIYVNLGEAQELRPGVLNKPDTKDNDENGFVDDIVGYDFVDGDGFPFDRVGTGTAAAGVIGAVHNNGVGIRGINPAVKIVPVRYVDSNGQAIVPNLVSALKYAKAVDAKVIYLQMANLSFEDREVAAQEKMALRKVLATLASSDTPIVVNAGNSGADVDSLSDSVLKLMADQGNVYIVTSTDSNDKRPFIANFGMKVVKSAAPGVDITTTLPGNHYGKESGTYLAAAAVTGAISLGLSRYGTDRYSAELYRILVSETGSDNVPSLDMETVSGNRLNVAKFLNGLKR